MRLIIAALLLAVATAAHAEALTVRTGESWVFTVKDGEPAHAKKVDATAKPGKGQLMVSVRALFGTSMMMINNSATPYTYRAELFVAGKPSGARTCDLPTGAQPTLEQWPQKADAVRISAFRPAGLGGHC